MSELKPSSTSGNNKLIHSLRLEGRDFGYLCAHIGIADTLFLWVGVKRWLSAWAIGFEVLAGMVVIFLGPFAFSVGFIKLGRFLEKRADAKKAGAFDAS